MAYQIEFAESVKKQFKTLTARQRVIILDAIERQLIDEPLKETRNRKVLRPNPLAPWELRVGDLRVFYEPDVVETAKKIRVLALGRKKGNKLYIGEKVVEL